jgi:hypothetical protein
VLFQLNPEKYAIQIADIGGGLSHFFRHPGMPPDFLAAFFLATAPVSGPIIGEGGMKLFPEPTHGTAASVLEFGNSHKSSVKLRIPRSLSRMGVIAHLFFRATKSAGDYAHPTSSLPNLSPALPGLFHLLSFMIPSISLDNSL